MQALLKGKTNLRHKGEQKQLVVNETEGENLRLNVKKGVVYACGTRREKRNNNNNDRVEYTQRGSLTFGWSFIYTRTHKLRGRAKQFVSLNRMKKRVDGS